MSLGLVYKTCHVLQFFAKVENVLSWSDRKSTKPKQIPHVAIFLHVTRL